MIHRLFCLFSESGWPLLAHLACQDRDHRVTSDRPREPATPPPRRARSYHWSNGRLFISPSHRRPISPAGNPVLGKPIAKRASKGYSKFQPPSLPASQPPSFAGESEPRTSRFRIRHGFRPESGPLGVVVPYTAAA